jgi:hypothetical protein
MQGGKGKEVSARMKRKRGGLENEMARMQGKGEQYKGILWDC